jgi:hypothetical protein
MGPLAIPRQGVTLEPPASRRVRALLAYLALAPHAQLPCSLDAIGVGGGSPSPKRRSDRAEASNSLPSALVPTEFLPQREAAAGDSGVMPAAPGSRWKDKIGLFIRTIGLARARTKIGLANFLYNMRRLIWLAGRMDWSRRRPTGGFRPAPVPSSPTRHSSRPAAAVVAAK